MSALALYILLIQPQMIFSQVVMNVVLDCMLQPVLLKGHFHAFKCISSAPECFQKENLSTMSSLPGIFCYADDVLGYGRYRMIIMSNYKKLRHTSKKLASLWMRNVNLEKSKYNLEDTISKQRNQIHLQYFPTQQREDLGPTGILLGSELPPQETPCRNNMNENTIEKIDQTPLTPKRLDLSNTVQNYFKAIGKRK
ncbi:unnamed protein product [Caretta caretta]